jgi:hypothetical protein
MCRTAFSGIWLKGRKPKEPFFSIPGQSPRLENKLSLCSKSFLSSSGLCPRVPGETGIPVVGAI